MVFTGWPRLAAPRMDDPLRAEGTLNRLHERGFKLTIDDFGTGYSSLAHLKPLPAMGFF